MLFNPVCYYLIKKLKRRINELEKLLAQPAQHKLYTYYDTSTEYKESTLTFSKPNIGYGTSTEYKESTLSVSILSEVEVV